MSFPLVFQSRKNIEKDKRVDTMLINLYAFSHFQREKLMRPLKILISNKMRYFYSIVNQ